MNEVYTIGMAWAMTLEAALKVALKEVVIKSWMERSSTRPTKN